MLCPLIVFRLLNEEGWKTRIKVLMLLHIYLCDIIKQLITSTGADNAVKWLHNYIINPDSLSQLAAMLGNIPLDIRAQWKFGSACAFAQSDQNPYCAYIVFWIAKDAKFLHVYNEDSDQTARMRRLIWVFVGRTSKKVRFLTLLLM